ncbi:MAG: hypothetical protein IPK26_16355 [Planctomycetes bacterium]|nr:hypothetical protein [Planctomycetota bacterium]
MIRPRSRQGALAVMALMLAAATLPATIGTLALVFGGTSVARLMGCMALAGVGLAVLAVARGRSGRRLGAVTAGAASFCVIWLLWPAGGTSPSSSTIRARFLDDRPRRPWLAGVAEQDLIATGAWLGLTSSEYRSTDGMAAECEQLAADARHFGNTDSWVVPGWFGDPGHYWLAVPAGEGPFPLLVFAHGSGGNFRFYARTVGLVAAAHGVLAAFPTMGLLPWADERGAERMAAVVAHVARDFAVDPTRITFVGISAGAPSALAAAAVPAGPPARVVLISGVYREPVAQLANRSLWIWHGQDDERAPLAAVQRFIDGARAQSPPPAVTVNFVPGRDHMLLLSEPESVTADLVAVAKAPRGAR